MSTDTYLSNRQRGLKQRCRLLREAAGYSQQDLAALLGCSRTRVTAVEDPDNNAEYEIGELELVGALCGHSPSEILSPSGQDLIDLGNRITEHETGASLVRLVEFELPEALNQFMQMDEFNLPALHFAPAGEIVVAILDEDLAQDAVEQGEVYKMTIAAWETKKGRCLGQTRLAYVDTLTVLDATRVAFATWQPPHPEDDFDHPGASGKIYVWNVQTGKLKAVAKLPGRPAMNNALAASRTGTYLAAFMDRTNTIQVWETKTWSPIIAYELELLGGGAPGWMFRRARSVSQLPNTRKLDAWGLGHQASQFAFNEQDKLVVGLNRTVTELPLSEEQLPEEGPFTHRVIPFNPLCYKQDERCEIAVMDIDYRSQPAQTYIELEYVVAHLTVDQYVSVQLQKDGYLGQPLILNDTCILAVATYDTPYPWFQGYRRLAGVCNLVSGRLVMLRDGGRLRPGDAQTGVRLTPRGDAVVYWVGNPDKKDWRLVLQRIDPQPLIAPQWSLHQRWADEAKRRQLERAGVHAEYERLMARRG